MTDTAKSPAVISPHWPGSCDRGGAAAPLRHDAPSSGSGDLVAIRTIWLTLLMTNYGSFWQHYCLREAIKSLGFRVVRVSEDGEGGLGLYRKLCLRALLRLRSPLDFWTAAQRLRFAMCFERLNAPVVEDFDDVSVRTVVVGGDQVFNPLLFDQVVTRFGGKARLITYSASCDWAQVARQPPSAWTSAEQFAAISVREKRGVEVVSEIFGTAEQVLDPVLLATRDALCGVAATRTAFRRRTLFAYLLNLEEADELRLPTLKELARRLDCELKIVGIQGAERLVPRGLRLTLAPQEFLAAIRDCAYFVTNSFHGTALAIQFRRPFATLSQRETPGATPNGRSQDLLAMVGLPERRVPADATVESLSALLTDAVDWAGVDLALGDARRRSLDWLGANLSPRKGQEMV